MNAIIKRIQTLIDGIGKRLAYVEANTCSEYEGITLDPGRFLRYPQKYLNRAAEAVVLTQIRNYIGWIVKDNERSEVIFMSLDSLARYAVSQALKPGLPEVEAVTTKVLAHYWFTLWMDESENSYRKALQEAICPGITEEEEEHPVSVMGGLRVPGD